MTVFDSRMYRDPMLVLQAKQEEAARKHRACGQRVHKRAQVQDGKEIYDCSKRQDYGWRCRFYRIHSTTWKTK